MGLLTGIAGIAAGVDDLVQAVEGRVRKADDLLQMTPLQAAHAIRERRQVPRETPTGSCNTCLVHDEIALATAFLEGIGARCPGPGEPIPQGARGTVPLARQHLMAAQGELSRVQGDELEAIAGPMRAAIPGLAERLKWVPTCEEAGRLSQDLRTLREQSFTLAERSHPPDPPAAHAPSVPAPAQVKGRVRRPLLG